MRPPPTPSPARRSQREISGRSRGTRPTAHRSSVDPTIIARCQPAGRQGRPEGVTTMELPVVPAWVRRAAVTPGTSAGEARLESARGAPPSRHDSREPRTADEAVAVLYGTHWHQLVR